MKRHVPLIACALFVTALLAGCGGNGGGDAEVQKVAENAGAAAKNLVDKAAASISSYKTKWGGAVALLEKGFEPVKEAAGSLDNEDLGKMVDKIGTGLTDVKSMLAGIGEGSGDAVDDQKKAFETKFDEVKGMLSSAESKIKELMPDFKKLGGGH